MNETGSGGACMRRTVRPIVVSRSRAPHFLSRSLSLSHARPRPSGPRPSVVPRAPRAAGSPHPSRCGDKSESLDLLAVRFESPDLCVTFETESARPAVPADRGGPHDSESLPDRQSRLGLSHPTRIVAPDSDCRIHRLSTAPGRRRRPAQLSEWRPRRGLNPKQWAVNQPGPGSH
jgi:hypothetical protein